MPTFQYQLPAAHTSIQFINASSKQMTFYLLIAESFLACFNFPFQNLSPKLQVGFNKAVLYLAKSTAQFHKHDQVYFYTLFRIKYTSNITSGYFSCFVSHSLF